MAGPWETTHDFFTRRLWQIDLTGAGLAKRWSVKTLQFLAVMVRDFFAGDLTLWATSLVYTTLLSLVPLLAVSFSVLKAFGVDNLVEPVLYEFLAPLGTQGVELADRVVGFVENVNAGVLGGIGLVFLIYTVVSVVSKLEDTFNHIWHIRSTRGFVERFSNYLSVLIIGPILVFAAMGLTAAMVNSEIVQAIIDVEPFGTLYYVAGLIMPYLLIIAAFTYVYIFLPNTRVHFKPALGAAVLAGLMWRGAGWFFAMTVAGSARYNAIYSGFAILVIAMIWVYISWLIFVLGAQMTFYFQHREYIRLDRPGRRLSVRLSEKLALSVMYWIALRYHAGDKPWTLPALSERFRVPQDALGRVVDALEERDLLVETNHVRGFVPGRDLETISLQEIVDAVRRAGEGQFVFDESGLDVSEVEEVTAQMDGALAQVLSHKTLHDWVVGQK